MWLYPYTLRVQSQMVIVTIIVLFLPPTTPCEMVVFTALSKVAASLLGKSLFLSRHIMFLLYQMPLSHHCLLSERINFHEIGSNFQRFPCKPIKTNLGQYHVAFKG